MAKGRTTNCGMITSHRSVYFWVFLSCFGIATFIILWLIFPGEPNSYFLIAGLSALALVPFIHGYRSKNIDYLEIIYPFSLMFLLYYPVRALYVLWQPAEFRWASPFVIYDDYLNIALFYSILGLSALLIGYYSPLAQSISKRIRQLGFFNNNNIKTTRIMIIYSIGVLFLVMSLRMGLGLFRDASYFQRPGPFTYYIVKFRHFALYAMSFTALLYFYKRPKNKFLGLLLWFVMIPTQFIYGFIYGAKNPLVYAVLIVLVAYNYLRQRVKMTKSVVAVLMIVFFVFPFINAYRANFVRMNLMSPTSTRGLIHNFKEISNYLTSLSFWEYYHLSINFVMNRSVDMDKLCAAIKYTPSLREFQYGRDWILIPAFAFIPRFIWYTKPTDVDYSVGFGREYLSLTSGVSIGTGNPGDFYMNFGLVGIILGMFLLGVLFRTVYLYLAASEIPKLPKLFFYTFLMLQMLNGFEGNIAVVYTEILKTIFIMSLTLWFIQGKKV